nr:hypothetical protein BaRGS_023552 [Batillaria attramentaria]
MLKLKHKIIPVVLEDAEHICASDKNLKTILDTVTYIKWPGVEDSKKTEKFWKLLELSMPKKKSDYSRSLSSQESCSSDRPLTSVSASCFNQIVENMSGTLYPQRSLSLSSVGEEESELTDRDRADSQATGDGRSLSGSDGDPPHPPAEISADSAPHALEELHVTSDDHIVEIRELSGNRVRVKPWLLDR